MTQTENLLYSPLIERFAIESIRDYYDTDVAAFKEFAGSNDSLLLGFILAKWRELNGDVVAKDNLVIGVIRELAAEAGSSNTRHVKADGDCKTGPKTERDERGVRDHMEELCDKRIERFKQNASVWELIILEKLLDLHESCPNGPMYSLPQCIRAMAF